MSSFGSKFLSITSWNVNGLSENFFLGNKLSNNDFLRFFNHCDIIVLTETWRTDEISLSGYEFFTKPSKKHHRKKNGRSSGGIAIGFRTVLKPGIQLISYHDNFYGPKLTKTILI